MHSYKPMLNIIPLLLLMLLNKSALAAPIELSLDDSINLALKNNYDIKYALAAREQAYWSLKESKQNKGPPSVLPIPHKDTIHRRQRRQLKLMNIPPILIIS